MPSEDIAFDFQETAPVKVQEKSTVNGLYQIAGKAELVKGEIIVAMPTGGLRGYAAGAIFFL